MVLSFKQRILLRPTLSGQVAEAKQDEFNERWENMEVELGRQVFNDLFSFIRMIYAKEKAKKSLLEEFRKHVLKDYTDPEKLIEDILEPYATNLSTVKKSNYQASSNAEINNSISWLNLIDNSDWIPTAILFLFQQKENPEYTRWFFKKLERLAAYLHICTKNINERISRYRKVIIALEEYHSLEKPPLAVELSEQEVTEMRSALSGDIYELSANRRSYIVLRLDSFVADGGASYKYATLTIEHVLPQTVNENSEWASLWPDIDKRQAWVHKIANLAPLNKGRNSKAQNFDFEKKKNAYFKGSNNVSSYILTTQVLSTPSWDEPYIVERQKELLKVFEDNWELHITTN